MNNNIQELISTVVDGDYCIGCGICASVKGSPFSMTMDENGKYKPFIEGKKNDELGINILSICPFSNESKNETEIGKGLFDNIPNSEFDEHIGYHLKNYAGFVKEGEFRKKGSSGGMGSWLTKQLLSLDLVDGIIHVKSSDDNQDSLFEYQISFDEDELLKGAKSRYYPVEMSKVIKFIRHNKGRYAIVGIPCFIKSIRLLADQDKEIKDSIKFCIALVCGHLKSDLFAKSIGWEMGVLPENLTNIDFRKKLEERAASDYGVEVKGIIDGEDITTSTPTRDLYTTNWGHGLFKYNACEYCDDVLGETADITIGDAWLPEYVKDSLGTNIISVRNPTLLKILEEEGKGKIHIEEISANKIYQSQAGGFRHRREGLSYRLYLKDIEGKWRPEKRVKPSNKLSSKRKKIYSKRTLLSQRSFHSYNDALKKKNFKLFVEDMDPHIKELDKLTAQSTLRKSLSKVKNTIKKIIN